MRCNGNKTETTRSLRRYQNKEQEEGDAHAELQQLADVYEQLVLGEVSDYIDGEDGETQDDGGDAEVVAVGLDVGSAVRLKKLGHELADAEAHDGLVGGGQTGEEARARARRWTD